MVCVCICYTIGWEILLAYNIKTLNVGFNMQCLDFIGQKMIFFLLHMHVYTHTHTVPNACGGALLLSGRSYCMIHS